MIAINLQAKMEINVQYDLFFHLTNCFNNFLALYKMSFSQSVIISVKYITAKNDDVTNTYLPQF